MKQLVPDFAWYVKVSKSLGMPPRCPFQNVNACPRYYASLSLLGSHGCTGIEEKEDKRLEAFWSESPLSPQTREQDTEIDSTEKGPRSFHRFCPEVSYDTFGYFATYFSRYADEFDQEAVSKKLVDLGASSKHPNWDWQTVTPQHYSECPLYAQLSHDWPKLFVKSKPVATSPVPVSGVRFDVFISHASEDKEDFVRPLAAALAGMGLKVWFDEWTLRIGDSLRQKIGGNGSVLDIGRLLSLMDRSLLLNI